MRRFAFACLAAGIVVVIDQVAKAAAVSGLSEVERVPLLGELLGLRLAFNPGATLSFGAGAPGLLALLGLAAVVLLVVAATRVRTGWGALGIGLILGGAIGNLIDRLFSPPGFGVGHVTDFLAYGDLFIGNLADVALGAGVIVLAGSLWSNRGHAAPSESGAPAVAEPTSVSAVSES